MAGQGFNSIDSHVVAIDFAAMSSDISADTASLTQAQQAARDGLAEVLGQDPVLAQAQITELLRLVPGKRALFAGQLNDQPVMFRHCLEANSQQQVSNQWAEMNRVCRYLKAPPYLINTPLHLGVSGDVMMLEFVEGRPLMQYMRHTLPEEKGLLTGLAVRWLQAYCQPSEEWCEVRVDSWLRRAGDAAARQPQQRLRAVEAQVLQRMQVLGGEIAGQSWRRAICHGDFHPDNLMFSDDALTGIDIGGSGRIPIYKDMARFLVHLARHKMLPSGRRHYGVDAAAFEEFAVVFGLSEIERSQFLPFMIGFEILFRVERATAKPKLVEAALRVAEGFLADTA